MIKRYLTILVLVTLLVQFLPGGLLQNANVEAQAPIPPSKISGLLEHQVQVKLQTANAGDKPALQAVQQAGQFDILEFQGLETSEPDSQQIFIHFTEKPTQAQLAELEAEGITPYPQSWIPPLEGHAT